MKQKKRKDKQNFENQFLCRCKKSYKLNASLFNHITKKHQNMQKLFNISNKKNGRPLGKKNKIQKESTAIIKQAKIFKCKCGDDLKGDGAFFNHLKYKHKNDSSFKPEKKQKGRKRKVMHDNLIKTDIKEKTQQQQPLILNTEAEPQIINQNKIISYEIVDQDYLDTDKIIETKNESIQQNCQFQMIDNEQSTINYIDEDKNENETIQAQNYEEVQLIEVGNYLDSQQDVYQQNNHSFDQIDEQIGLQEINYQASEELFNDFYQYGQFDIEDNYHQN